MKFIDFFAGVGGFRRGMELAGHECVGFCEFDKYATASYTAMHLATDEQLEKLKKMTLKQRQKEILKEEYRNGEWYVPDIKDVTGENVPEADCWCFGAPCFVAGTLVTTSEGVKPIEDIKSGDFVLTHKNRFQKVVKPMKSIKSDIYSLKIQGVPLLECTSNHRFWIRYKNRVWNNDTRKYENKWSEPEWKQVSEFNGNEYFLFSLNQQSENRHNFSEDELWLMGRYVADGYIRDTPRKDRPSNIQRVVWCIGNGKEESFEKHSKNIQLNKSKQVESCTKYQSSDKKLFNWCHCFGSGAENKNIPGFIMDLPPELLKIFLDGYMAGDGNVNKNGSFQATTISKKLAYQLGQCVNKVYHTPYRLYFTKREDTHIINEREVNQNDTWMIRFSKTIHSQDHGKIIDGLLWMPLKNIEHDPNRIEVVYNMEVENDNSYTVNNIAAHNCQDFSVAGVRSGLKGDRSSLVREVFRVLGEIEEEHRPEWLIYENVKGMLSSNKGFDYLAILLEMDELGYDVEWKIFNSKDYVPQNRERVYTVGHLRRRGSRKVFFEEGASGEDNLQEIVPEVIGGVGEINFGKQWRQGNRVYDSNKVATALEASPVGNAGGMTNLYFIDVDKKKEFQKIDIIGHRNGYRRNLQTFWPKGITETMDTAGGGGRNQHVAVPIDVIGSIDPSRHSQMDIHSPVGLMSCLDTINEKKKICVVVDQKSYL